MSARHIDYYFWLNSDWAYLGADRLAALARRQRVAIRYRPVDLPDIYARTGGILLSERAPERQAYRIVELRRWCRRLGIHVNPQPRYMCPDAGHASRLVIAADAAGFDVATLARAILRAQWSEERNIASEATLHDILSENGLPANTLLAASHAPDMEQRYKEYTDAAVRAGVFGSPSYVFDGELFWGQDRLDMLEERIARA